uniref:signal-recognition-particle GTPase n=1 Tax=Trepomonas sp. PC1 TaxID=1076344 RepID=A0A146KFK3_9EUKA|eukprot:JAP95247.1 Signal recognition particle 54 [Trepomonas sp. PC1]
MVLNELGERLSKAMGKLMRSRMIDQRAVDALVSDITAALEEADVNQEILQQLKNRISKQVIENAKSENLQQFVTELVMSEVTAILDPGVEPYRPNPRKANIIAFYGLQGQGKTTTCAKYGAFYKKRGWKVGVICCDTFRAGAFDQLKQNCAQVKLPYYGSYSEKDPVKIARDGVAHFKKLNFNLIILDTSGRHRQSEDLLQEMKQIDSAVQPDDRIFVVDSSIGQAVHDQALAFKKAVNIGSIILTKMDGSARSGGALAAVSATKAPIVFIGTGEKFDAFEEFEASRFVGKLMGFGDMRGMVDMAMNSGVDHKKQSETLSKMISGEFTFQSFKDQVDQVSKMGPMDKIIEMIPGMKGIADAYGFDDEKEGTGAMIRWGHMFQSMTKGEMAMNPQTIMKSNFESRVLRIARGSGYTVERVREFFKQAKQFQDQTQKIGKNPYGQNMKQMLEMQKQAADGNLNQDQMAQLQAMMKGMPKLPGMAPGADPQQAVAQLRQMGLLPDDMNQAKKMKKMMQGKK